MMSTLQAETKGKQERKENEEIEQNGNGDKSNGQEECCDTEGRSESLK